MAIIYGTEAGEVLNGTESDDTIYGIGGNDTINGLGGNDTLIGSIGNDTLDGGTGDDVLMGKVGFDAAAYLAGVGQTRTTRSRFTIALVNGNGTIADSVPGGFGTDTMSSIETAKFDDDVNRSLRGDFNGDRRSDLLLRTNGQFHISFISSNGFGTAAAPTDLSFDLANNRKSVVGLGDVNADGRAEAILRDVGTGVVSSLSYVSGSTASETTIGSPSDILGANWRGLAVADFDGDGKADILWRDETGAVRLWLLDGAAIASTVNVSTVLGNAWQLQAAADMNGDGRSDLVWRNVADGTVRIWLMNGGTITQSGDISGVGLDWRIETAGDLDGDGKADLIWKNFGSSGSYGTLVLWTMDGVSQAGGQFLAIQGTSSQVEGVFDATGDGRVEVVTRSETPVYLHRRDASYSGFGLVPFNNGIGTVGTPFYFDNTNEIEASPRTLRANSYYQIALDEGAVHWDQVANIATINFGNSDGGAASDVIWRNADGGLYLWSMASGVFAAGGTITGGPAYDQTWQVAGSGDFNGDGKSDVLWRNVDGRMAISLLDGATVIGTTSLTQFQDKPYLARVDAVGDLDGDGSADIVWTVDENYQFNTYVSKVVNGQITSTSYLGALNGQVIGLANVDGVPGNDIVTYNADANQVAYYRTNGTSIITGQSIFDTPTSDVVGVVGLGDVDGDGVSDLIFRNTVTGAVSVALLDVGADLRSMQDVASAGLDWQVQGTGDFNADGKTDILWRNADGRTAVWLLNGASIIGGGDIGSPSMAYQTLAKSSLFAAR